MKYETIELHELSEDGNHENLVNILVDHLVAIRHQYWLKHNLHGSELEMLGGVISFSTKRLWVRETPEEVKAKLKTIGAEPSLGS